MSNDGITDAFQDFFESLSEVGDLAIESLKEQIDIETDRSERELKDKTPVGETGGLAKSLTKKTLNKQGQYGYVLEYAGENKDGVPYEKIANILNNGSSTIKPKRFIAKTVRQLKGLDDRAAKRFEEKLKT